MNLKRYRVTNPNLSRAFKISRERRSAGISFFLFFRWHSHTFTNAWKSGIEVIEKGDSSYLGELPNMYKWHKVKWLFTGVAEQQNRAVDGSTALENLKGR